MGCGGHCGIAIGRPEYFQLPCSRLAQFVAEKKETKGTKQLRTRASYISV